MLTIAVKGRCQAIFLATNAWPPFRFRFLKIYGEWFSEKRWHVRGHEDGGFRFLGEGLALLSPVRRFIPKMEILKTVLTYCQ